MVYTPLKNRPRFRDQSLGGILWRMLVVLVREAEQRETAGRGTSADGHHTGTRSGREILVPPRALAVAGAAVLLVLVLVSLAVLAQLYNTRDRVGLQPNPTPAPTEVPTPAPFVAPAAVPLTVTAVLQGGSGPLTRLLQPQEAILGAGGRVYVADTGNHRVAILDRKGMFTGAITQGQRGALQSPFSLALTADGILVVLDSDAGQVLEYAPSGKLLRASDPALSLVHARGIALDPSGKVLVADPASNVVDTLGPDLALVHQQPAASAGAAALFNQPSAVGAGADGTIYVVDSQNSRVAQFTSDWQPLKAWPTAMSDTQHSPRVAPQSGGRLLVSDPRDGRLLLFAADSSNAQAFTLNGPDGPCDMPLGVATGRNDLVLVTCGGSNQVMELHLPQG